MSTSTTRERRIMTVTGNRSGKSWIKGTMIDQLIAFGYVMATQVPSDVSRVTLMVQDELRYDFAPAIRVKKRAPVAQWKQNQRMHIRRR